MSASPLVLAIWLAACALLLVVVLAPVPVGTRYDSAKREFDLPGSWVPMALILGIFLTKYGVGDSLAIAASYSVFSAIFAARTVSLLRMARRPAADRQQTPLPA